MKRQMLPPLLPMSSVGILLYCSISQKHPAVNEATCASCVHNKPENDCKRPLEWMWRGEVFPASMNESDSVRATLEYESVPNPRDPTGPYVSFLELEPQDQNSKFRERLKGYCQKVYERTHNTRILY